uniref:Uncharacterized protein n=1 Tax=Rhizophora mucronata TaxID=61149 RepID=A0A2P2Q1N6_RHIMU
MDKKNKKRTGIDMFQFFLLEDFISI